MPGSHLTTTCTAWFQADDDDPAVELGTVSIDREGRLGVMQARPGHEQRLAGLVEAMNAKPMLHVDAGGGIGPRHAHASRPVMRGDPDFVGALRDHLATYHGVDLV